MGSNPFLSITNTINIFMHFKKIDSDKTFDTNPIKVVSPTKAGRLRRILTSPSFLKSLYKVLAPITVGKSKIELNLYLLTIGIYFKLDPTSDESLKK